MFSDSTSAEVAPQGSREWLGRLGKVGADEDDAGQIGSARRVDDGCGDGVDRRRLCAVVVPGVR